ncbi:type IV toxin-antitoxin system AbiEi family antitoxin domain-containing protein [Mycobacterium camsae]|uniref:type IV toxin-antitoxin system AbiEi family antitoxin domain-containing protein n=1 Tax=Mycobacterium gordonae TaxID=1778 RepID=UPI00198165C3|nr:type IV toxin-antitoxin system AbiEi family antitoxin domain-containing protein [Mycobacterium gordonae]
MAATERYLQLADIAAGQWGLVTAAQARHVGLTHQQLTRMARSGILHRLHHGVYRLAGVPPDPFTELKVSWLALDPAATAAERLERSDPVGVVSHRSAARVHQLGDLDADLNEFTLTAGKRTRDPDTRIYKRALDRSDWQVIGGLPTTTVGVTLADLAAATTDGGHLGSVLRDAILHAKITYLDAAAVLRPYAHEYGAPLGNGRTLVKTLLAQTGLSKTIAAAAQFDDPDDTWLTDQLNTAASRYLGGTAFRRAADQVLVDQELMGATDFYGLRRQPGTA